MAKIKTEEDTLCFSTLGEWTNWNNNKEYGYSMGVTLTRQGMIDLYWQKKDEETFAYATARIIHEGEIYDLRTHDKVTKLGWVRIAKKWARKIWSQK